MRKRSLVSFFVLTDNALNLLIEGPFHPRVPVIIELLISAATCLCSCTCLLTNAAVSNILARSRRFLD